MNDKKKWGRFFTKKDWLLDKIINLVQNGSNILEPCCGVGHIVAKLESKYNNITAIDIIESPKICKTNISYMNFFDFSVDNKYDTIITNPPYVSYRVFDNNLITNWKSILPKTNLYMYFIEKCFKHLAENGELILIIPIDFINNTRGEKLRKLLYKYGTITNIINMCDKTVFSDCSPDVIIIRYQKCNLSHKMIYQKTLEAGGTEISDTLYDGTYNFNNFNNFKYLKDFFNIKVGIVIGGNNIFEYESELSIPIITSDFFLKHKRKSFLFLENLSLNEIQSIDPNIYKHLLKNKPKLIKRKVKKCNENNWWKWGGAKNIKYMNGDTDCIFVNQRTRYDNPFFIHKTSFFDGTMICLIPKQSGDLNKWITFLNNNPEMFRDQGLLVNNKYMFNKLKLGNFKILEKKLSFL